MLGMIFGPDGIVVIVVVAIVLIFGGAKLPSLARGLGSAAHEFKKGVGEGDSAPTELPKSHATIESGLKRNVAGIEHLRDESLPVGSSEDDLHP